MRPYAIFLRRAGILRSFGFLLLAFVAITALLASTNDCRAAESAVIQNNNPATVCDASGNIWAVWHAGPAGNRDIFLGKRTTGSDTFDTSVRLTSNGFDQVNPAIALGTDDRLYLVWEDNRRGNWDIYGSTSADGINWSAERRIADSDDKQNFNQINPALAVDGRYPNHAYVVWQDDRAGNYDIYIAESSDGFITNVIEQVTSDTSDQTTPAIAVSPSNTAYILWTDFRNTANGADIYGASGSPWTNVPVVTKAADQLSPQLAFESADSNLHMLWTDQIWGDSDIYYASSSGLPTGLTGGVNLIDDTLKAEQFSPSIAVVGAGSWLKVFACWQDERNLAGGTGDVDIYAVQVNSGSGTNVLIGDGGTNSDQTEPAMGIDQYGYPYVVWTDSRSVDTIYYAGSAYAEPTVLVSGLVTASAGGTVGTGDVRDIADTEDVSIAIPAGACPYDVTVSITRIANPHDCLLPSLGGWDFGPSGLEFNLPVTITIPYAVSSVAGAPAAYWYDSHTGAASQEGIANVEIIDVNANLQALRFTTTHLTPYYALLEAAPDGGGGTGGTGKGNNDKSQKGRDNNNAGGSGKGKKH